MTDPIILQDRPDAAILRLTLNDPTRRNALSEAMLLELHRILNDTASDKTLKVIIIAANGSVFCAGHDLKELTAARAKADKGEADFTRIMDLCAEVMQKILAHPRPVIAEVFGMATAAGCQLVASCDLAIAADTAQFCTPGVHIGLFCSTPMVALSRNVATKHAMDMLLTGDPISAEKAEAIGLVNRVTSSETLSDATLALARKIASKSNATVAIGKRAFYEQREMTLANAYDYAAHVMVQNMLDPDAKEGISAFIEKRQPVWQGES